MPSAPSLSPAPSGLGEKSRTRARSIFAHGCGLLLANPGLVHYTQGARRWDGINKRLLVSHGDYPSYGDCSSTLTWLLWNALYVSFGVGDVVNHEHWQAGYTGTMLQGGKVVAHESNLKVGDMVIFGRPGTTGEHVAGYLGGGMVFSHGSEGGPYKLPLRYRSDVLAFRRAI